MGGVGGHVDRLARSGRQGLTAEGHLDLAVEDGEHLLEVVAVRRRAASWGDVHVDERVPAIGVVAADQDRVGVAYQAQVRQALVVVGSGDGEPAGGIVIGDGELGGRRIVGHGGSFHTQ